MYKHKNGISLVKLERTQLPMLLELKADTLTVHTTAILNMDDQQKWFDSLDNRKNIVMVAYDDIEPIGLYKISNIDWMNRKYDSAHDVFEQQRGKGYGSKVLAAGVAFGFEVMNMNRLDSEVLENNPASLNNAKKCGFKIEGVKSKAIYKAGKYINSIVIGILREDWDKLQ